MLRQNLYLTFVTGLLLAASLQAQVLDHKPSDFRSDVNYRRNSNVDGNNIRATIFNSGYSGDPSNRPDYVEYEWPKNTNRIYIALIDILLGGEVTSNKGEKIYLVEVPQGRTDPTTGNSWNIEPVPGFMDPQQSQIARSDRKSSWPTAVQKGWRDKRTDPNDPGWVGSWNGFFGKNIFNADQEFYYVTSDDLYKRQPYTPDTTDLTRGGLGLIMDVRTLAWSQILINDILFSIHDIKNDGTKPIDKVSFLMFVADWVGGDSPDDLPYVDLQSATTFLTDADRIGTEAFGSSPVGTASLKYLETPGNQVDGIDNDGDSDDNPAVQSRMIGDPEVRIPHFTSSDFTSKTLRPGDKIVLIEPGTYDRVIATYPANGGTVKSLGKEYVLPQGGLTVKEDTVANGYDDDLDGLIDEKESLHLYHVNEITKTTNPVRYINYLSFMPGDTLKRGFIVPGVNAQWNYESVAPMIDESRDDGFDNDNDWDSFLDDNGLDGQRGTADAGEGDGKPSSGAGTEFPGEPGIDKTDVSETDAIGITSAVQIQGRVLSFNTTPDKGLWDLFMAPGNINLVRTIGEWDTYVSSAYFPLLPGQRQRMAVSIALAGGGNTKEADIESVIKKQKQAELAYRADYQFAQAPLQVTVTAVPGDGQVRLYWDDIAEKSFDRYINKIGGNGRDFEGYRIYRATDAAFLDAKTVTDAYGVKTLMRPIAEFDLKDGVTGLHPIDINGVKFDLGNDSGLKHEFIDRDVVNGQRYFYAVTAYDFGYANANIPPTETPIQVNVETDGTMTYGINVAVVRPSESAAGYIPPQVEQFTHQTGGANGKVNLKVIDPTEIKSGNEYEITFRDSVYKVDNKDAFKTVSFSLKNITENKYLLENDTRLGLGDEISVTDGFRLSLDNVQDVSLNTLKTGWNKPGVFAFNFDTFTYLTLKGIQNPSDYKIIFGEAGFSKSKDTTLFGKKFNSVPVNFKVINTTQNKEIEFVFSERDGSDGKLTIDTSSSKSDAVYFVEEDKTGKLRFTWQLALNRKGLRNPEAGDSATVILNKPFLSYDTYRFRMKGSAISTEKAKENLGLIRVVPNPYVAAETWEPRNTFTSGRGPREIHFINLPSKCTIRIFNVSGAQIKKIEHDSALENGTEIWDVLSDEKFEISYGIYVYHVDAPGVGQKTGTFAIIK
ncbi:MAG: hypothetical protein ACM3QX_14630 [Syntrophomonadaceae bacterium]